MFNPNLISPDDPIDPPTGVLRYFEADLTGPASTSDLCWEALSYYDLGYCPIPGRPESKAARIRWKPYQEERPSRDLVLDWFTQHSNNNLCLLTGGSWRLLVFDVDPRNDGDKSFASLVSQYGEEPFAAPVVHTPSGGTHRYYRVPEGLVLPTRVGLFPGIDIKAQRGLVLAPPTKKNDKTYEWATGDEPSIEDLPPVPGFLIEKVLAKIIRPRTRRPQTQTNQKDPTSSQPATQFRSPEEKEEFAELWDTLGITLEAGDHPYRCAFHDDENPSLHIDDDRCIWHCFPCGMGGGLVDLRTKMGLAQEPPQPPDVGTSLYTKQPSPKTNTDITGQGGSFRSCPQPMGLYQQESTSGRGFMVPCRQLTCPSCGPRQRRAQAEHYTNGLLSLEQPVFVTVIPISGRESFARKVQRRHCAYLACPSSDGFCTVFTTLVCADGATVLPELLEASVAQALTDIPHHGGGRGLNVSCSKPLSMPARMRKEGVETFRVASLDRLADRSKEEGRLRYRDGGGRRTTTRVEVEAPQKGTLEWLLFVAQSGITSSALGSPMAGRRLTPADMARHLKPSPDVDDGR